MRKRIGEYLVDRGILTLAQVEQILAFSQNTGTRFGEAGIELGLLSRESLVKAFGKNYSIDFFHVQPEYFPAVTKSLINPEDLIRYGMLPLGFKSITGLFRARKLLNLGLLDPSRQDAIEAVTTLAGAKVGDEWAGVKSYLILPMDFVQVLEQVYGINPQTLATKSEEAIDPVLRMFLIP